MAQTVSNVLRVRFEELVAESVKLVHAMTRYQFAVSDAALKIAPLRCHGGDMSLGEDELGGGGRCVTDLR